MLMRWQTCISRNEDKMTQALMIQNQTKIPSAESVSNKSNNVDVEVYHIKLKTSENTFFTLVYYYFILSSWDLELKHSSALSRCPFSLHDSGRSAPSMVYYEPYGLGDPAILRIA
jgi:hypothetical protein